MQNLPNSIISPEYFYDRFPSEKHALEYLDEARWGGKPRCPYCESGKGTGKGHRNGWRRCHNHKCKRCFSSRQGTIFENSLVPLHKWFLGAYYMMLADGSSGIRLRDELGVAPVTAWHMAHRICIAMGRSKDGTRLSGTVEIARPAFGGAEGFKHSSKRLWLAWGQKGGKHGAFSMTERGDLGRTISIAVPSKPGKNIYGKPVTEPDYSWNNLLDVVGRFVAPDSIVITIDDPLYGDLAKEGLAGRHIKLECLADKSGSYPGLDIENGIAAGSKMQSMKNTNRYLRGWDPKYLQRYLDAADFRYNETRVLGEDGKFLCRAPTLEAFETFIRCCLGMPLTRGKVMA